MVDKKNLFSFLVILSFLISFFSCKTSDADPYTAFNYDFNEEHISVPSKGEDGFTIAVLPDIQNYTIFRCQKEYNPKFPMSYHEILDRQMDFVANNSFGNGGGIGFAIFLGDLVSKRNEHLEEWIYADNAISKLDSLIPFGVVIGNHDYDKWDRKKKSESWQVSGTKFYTKYFGSQSKHFAGKSWYRGSTENDLNSYIIFNACGYDFLFIGLEFEPSDEAIAWAQSVIDSHPDLPCIIATHGFLRLAKEKASGNNRFVKMTHRKEGEGNSGSSLFKKLIKPNKNVFLVLCGHVCSGPEGEGMRVDVNDFGYKVYSILSNYQNRADTYKAYGLDKDYGGAVEENGDGFLRLMNFDFKRKICHVQTYSTEFKTFEIDADSDFFIDLEWDSRFTKKDAE